MLLDYGIIICLDIGIRRIYEAAKNQVVFRGCIFFPTRVHFSGRS